MKLTLSVEGEPYRRVEVEDYVEASRVWLAFKSQANGGTSFGGSDMTRDCGAIYNGLNRQVAYVSYNGRVWPGKATDWKMIGVSPLLEPE